MYLVSLFPGIIINSNGKNNLIKQIQLCLLTYGTSIRLLKL